MLYGYARVSSKDQNLDRQISALTAYLTCNPFTGQTYGNGCGCGNFNTGCCA